MKSSRNIAVSIVVVIAIDQIYQERKIERRPQ
jgi:hypothetical protein